ncbi:hypothetical protein HH310_23460 [Actinoplanes sp. TBRC 11911]|uniref:hypothetical protein n=1 Tax=Actinoplanes sp. TBRC 11911 TaxID=2729386 RepID=UPI00145F220A|nr:hypothetical protein [Actinoplanes sp. TBRC 11911]NMO54128.1 hypothetical protein [Actinoplanes sp. TBRC 11911]
MDELTRISPATRAALVAVAQGSCYFPGCRTPILVALGSQPEINIEFARIRSADPAQPRYVAGTSDEDSFHNLLLLCVPHRRTVDRDATAHPVELLESWVPSGALDDLGPLSPARLADLLTSAFWTAKEQVADALLRLEKTDSDAAQLLRHLLDDQRSRYAVDPEIAAILHRVARALDQLVEPEPAPRRSPRPERPNIGWRP